MYFWRCSRESVAVKYLYFIQHRSEYQFMAYNLINMHQSYSNSENYTIVLPFISLKVFIILSLFNYYLRWWYNDILYYFGSEDIKYCILIQVLFYLLCLLHAGNSSQLLTIFWSDLLISLFNSLPPLKHQLNLLSIITWRNYKVFLSSDSKTVETLTVSLNFMHCKARFSLSSSIETEKRM